MIAVIFEVIPHADKKQAYLDMAAEMRPLVEQIDGFLSGIEDVATACAESGFAAQGIGVAEQDFRTTVRAQD